jgi:hypothetical protein
MVGPGPDRVRLIKQESASTGGSAADDDPMGSPTPIETDEDAIESAGGYVHAQGEPTDQTVGWYRSNGLLYLFDQNNPLPGASVDQLLVSAQAEMLCTDEADAIFGDDGNAVYGG